LTILDGKKLSQQIRESIKEDVEELKSSKDITPGLAVVLVGSDAASATYVKMKSKACNEAGIYSIVHEMPETISQESILDTIDMMNKNPNIDGILVQLPLPSHVDTTTILEAIDPAKDVDGFHPFNVGRVVAGLDGFIPATPYGVMELFKEYDIDLTGKNVCVVGASNIVGKPLAALLLNANATVEVCHIYTKNLKEHTLKADVVCVGVGKIDLITPEMIKDDAIVIDIGINKSDEGKIVGDVSKSVEKKCSFITPVPGGVGPMTIAMLLKNTLKSAQNRK
jgi:methylenetetrahydrofolate dehydrogenase (NADP+)/methenyltetrahydrofolate cyclohydrolase